jgi:parallel beta-helix repeat protein
MGNTCRSQLRQCVNGTLNGTYAYASCSVTATGADPLAGTCPAVSLVDSGAITISGQSNQTITGKHIHTTSGACVTVTNSTNITFIGNEIGPCGTDQTDSESSGITIDKLSSALHIYDNYIHVDNQVLTCTKTHVGVNARTGMAGSIDIKGNVIAYSERAIWLDEVSNATINGNFFLNMRMSVNCRSSANKYPHAVQIWSDSGTTTGTVITNNYVLATAARASVNGVTVQFPGAGSDGLSVSYTVGAKLLNNYVDYTGAAGAGNVETGTCGVIADVGTTGTTIDNNIVSNTYNCGVSLASGSNSDMSGNKVLLLRPTSANASGVLLEAPATCSKITINNNTSYAQQSGGYNQAAYNYGNCTSVTFSGNTGGNPNMGSGCGPASSCAAYVALYPMATTNPPPKIPPVPHTYLAPSPYSNNTTAPSCE